MRILVTGATGYIGGRLVRRLLDWTDHEVRVFARRAESARARPWGADVEIVEGDLSDPEALRRALEGIDVAFYLVHSMYGGGDFEERDRQLARTFVEAGGHLQQVIYLGGIVPGGTGETLSDHLSSRAEVGAILREGLPTTEFRAGPIIGSGSASFEMVRYLTERLPVMITPKWVRNEVQPISVRNVQEYLIGAIGRPETVGVIDIGTDPVTFRGMMQIYAEVRGLPRKILPVPVLAPRLAALWVGLVTPIPNSLAVPLVEGVVEPVVGDTRRARELFPDIDPLPYRTAVIRALDRIEQNEVATRWTFSGASRDAVELEDREGIVRETRQRVVQAPIEAVFQAFSSVGGERGWPAWDGLWRLRGLLDQIVGGPGLRRGRRHPWQVYPGEAIDFWRVEAVDPPKLLRLRAEMKVPGKAWLQFEAEPAEEGGTRLIQTAYFAPTGFLGWAYWWSLYPAHAFIFDDMVDALVRDAKALADDPGWAPGPHHVRWRGPVDSNPHA
jgi:uncharacterized protein YbjT (DUF2867 family)/uncharacterized protein YndB with AHSA1/START domain